MYTMEIGKLNILCFQLYIFQIPLLWNHVWVWLSRKRHKVSVSCITRILSGLISYFIFCCYLWTTWDRVTTEHRVYLAHSLEIQEHAPVDNLSASVDWGHCAIQSKDAKANDIFTKHLLWHPLAPKIDPFVEAEFSWFSHRPEVPAALLASRLPVHDLWGIPLSHSSCFENRVCYCTLNA